MEKMNERERRIEQQLNFVIPQNMDSLRVLLTMAGWGWQPIGVPKEFNRGYIDNGGHPFSTFIRTRSMDALRLIAANRCDVGFVGSDCIEEKPEWPVEILGKFPFGRLLNGRQPRLEVVVPSSSPVKNLAGIKPGAIIFTERPRITDRLLQENGLATIIESNDDPALFREILIKQNKVGIWVILGSSPVQLGPDNDYGVIVNETGITVAEYGLRVIAKIGDINTQLIASRLAMQDEEKRARICKLMQDLEVAYRSGKIYQSENF